MQEVGKYFLGFMKYYWILLFSFFFTSMLLSGFQVYSFVYIRNLGASSLAIGRISFLSSPASVAIFPFRGLFGRRLGLKKMFILGPLVAFLALIIVSSFCHLAHCALSLVLIAVSTALVTPSVLAFRAVATSQNRLGIAYGGMFAVLSLCSAFGSIFVGNFIAYFGYLSGLRTVLLAGDF